jgi:hypothetical protein
MMMSGPAAQISFVMAGFIPAIHVFLPVPEQDVDARDKPGHDGKWARATKPLAAE